MKGGLGEMDICICMAESLPCSPETITILLIGYSPIQSKKGLNICLSPKKWGILRDWIGVYLTFSGWS